MDGKTEKQLDMLKLRVAFRNFANKTNKSGTLSHVLSISEPWRPNMLLQSDCTAIDINLFGGITFVYCVLVTRRQRVDL